MRNSKKIILPIIGILIFAFLVWIFDLMFYPCTYLRNDIHTLSTEKIDVLIQGTSNGKMGIDPDILLKSTGLSGHNLAAGSEYPVDSYYMLKLLTEKNNPRYVIYDIDPGYFTTEKEAGNNYLLFIHEFPISFSKIMYGADILKGLDLRSLLFSFYEYPIKTTTSRIGTNIKTKLAADYSTYALKNQIQEYHENGFIEKFPVEESKFPSYEMEHFDQDDIVFDNIEYLNRLIKLCNNEDITFIALTMPLPDKTLNDNAENLDRAYEYFENYFEEQGVEYINFNTEYYDAFPHDEKCFVDYDGHLNGDSAREFSSVFASILNFNQKEE